MTRDFLKSLELTDEAINKIMAEYGKSINDLKGKNDTYLAQIDELNGKLATYSDYEEYKGYKAKYDELSDKYTTDLNKARLDNVITEKLYKSKAKNVDLIKKSIDYDSIKTNENGEYTGIDEQINSLKESDGYLFVNEKESIPTTTTVGLGNDKSEVKPVDPVADAFYRRNPELMKNKW